MPRPGSDCSIVARKRSNVRGAKGVGNPAEILMSQRVMTRRNSLVFGRRRQPLMDYTSRMNREVQVRICERLGVKFPGSTRLLLTSKMFAVCEDFGCMARQQRRLVVL
jgi:hypothetical protein